MKASYKITYTESEVKKEVVISSSSPLLAVATWQTENNKNGFVMCRKINTQKN